MVSTTTVFPSSVERLPVEIIQAIMMSLDEAASLPSLVLTCRSFYHAFKDAESFIIKNIVADELGPHVLLEAITTFDLASKAATNRLILDVYVLHNSFPRNNFIPIIDLSRAVALSRFHFYVRYFTLEYISTTLSKCPIIFRAEKHILPPASQTEISRIQRAFYRFEMFRLLGFNGQARNEDRGSFLNLFAPWENNQLACVNHYFYTIVSPAFNNFVEHDVTWGQCQVPSIDNPTKPRFQHILTRGLEGLYSIAKAQTYEERTKVLYDPFPKLDRHFLYWALQEANLRSHNLPYTTSLGNFTFSQRESFIKPSFFLDDADTGPKDAWFDAHRGDPMLCWIFPETDRGRTHREWGYVMWDRARVQHFDFDYIPRGWRRQRDESQKKKEIVCRSWPRRAKIHLAGGRGWWSEDDESKVVWVGDASPWDDKEARGKCKYCIGAVRCAPHRICLRVPGERALLNRNFELGWLKIPVPPGASGDLLLQGPDLQLGVSGYTPVAASVRLAERSKYQFENEEEDGEMLNEVMTSSAPQENTTRNSELVLLSAHPSIQVPQGILNSTVVPGCTTSPCPQCSNSSRTSRLERIR